VNVPLSGLRVGAALAAFFAGAVFFVAVFALVAMG